MGTLQIHGGPDKGNPKGHPRTPEANDGEEDKGSGRSDVGAWAQSELREADISG